MYDLDKAYPLLSIVFSADSILESFQKVPLRFAALKIVLYGTASASAHHSFPVPPRGIMSSCYTLPDNSSKNLCYNIPNCYPYVLEVLQS